MAPGIFACFRRSTSSSAENTTADQSVEEHRRAGAVLVELFSSQGCATSPEAELLLSRLGRGDFQLESPVIPLAYHVDYWDHLGWKDPFGSSIWTVRQKAYVEALRLDTLYTPQLVIQGRLQCLGTDQDALLSAIASATRFPAPTLQVSIKLNKLLLANEVELGGTLMLLVCPLRRPRYWPPNYLPSYDFPPDR
ncbi:hypothetical protein ACLOJK_039798 [Asimina triloba]